MDTKASNRTSAQGDNVNVSRAERLASAVGGGLMALYSFRHPLRRMPLAVAGAGLLARGARGHSRVYDRLHINTAKPEAAEMVRSITVNRPLEEVYRFWRNLENLPRFMRHLRSVKELSPTRSHWVAQPPMSGRRQVEWDAEIVEERRNEMIRWRSLPGSDVENDGIVWFKPAPGNRGTEVHVTLRYRPSTASGAILSGLMSPVSTQMLKEEIRAFKSVIETGEAPTTEGQPSARERKKPSREQRAA